MTASWTSLSATMVPHPSRTQPIPIMMACSISSRVWMPMMALTPTMKILRKQALHCQTQTMMYQRTARARSLLSSILTTGKILPPMVTATVSWIMMISTRIMMASWIPLKERMSPYDFHSIRPILPTTRFQILLTRQQIKRKQPSNSPPRLPQAALAMARIPVPSISTIPHPVTRSHQ